MTHQITGVLIGNVSPDCKKVVVGIDFGTAYSGISFSFRGDPKSIRCGAPTSREPDQLKVPTFLAWDVVLKKWFFGYEAEDRYNEAIIQNCFNGDKNTAPTINNIQVKMFKRYKMILHNKISGFETLKAISEDGTSCLLMTLISETLKFLKDFAKEKIMKGCGALINIDPNTDIMWILTVPAIWNDFGKAFMRKAAYISGMINTEMSDNLSFVLEPEGAAIAIHAGISLLDGAESFTKVGSKFIVLDCGGGTVDITAHEVFNSAPLNIGNLIIPTGGPWGAEKINQEFNKFLLELLGNEIYQNAILAAEYYKFCSEFDTWKRNFDPMKEQTISLSLKDLLADVGDLEGLAHAYNRRNNLNPVVINIRLKFGWITISKELMLSFFEPSFSNTCNAVTKITNENKEISTILLVGGFGASPVLIARLNKTYENNKKIKIISGTSNPRPQAAISHGAIYYGMYRQTVVSRIASFTYGIERYRNKFDVLVGKGDFLPMNHEVKMDGYPAYSTAKSIGWRILISSEKNPRDASSAIVLGEVNCPAPVSKNESDDRKQTATIKFETEILFEVINSKGNTVREVIKMK